MKDTSAIYTEEAGKLTPMPPMEELAPISSSNPPLTGCLPFWKKKKIKEKKSEDS
jgi:hypothetical protein